MSPFNVPVSHVLASLVSQLLPPSTTNKSLQIMFWVDVTTGIMQVSHKITLIFSRPRFCVTAWIALDLGDFSRIASHDIAWLPDRIDEPLKSLYLNMCEALPKSGNYRAKIDWPVAGGMKEIPYYGNNS